MTSEHRYASGDLTRNYVRALIGLAICIAPFFWVTPILFFTVILVGMGAVFAALLLQTAARQLTYASLDENGITLGNWRSRRIAWSDLAGLDLAYYEGRGFRRSSSVSNANIMHGGTARDLDERDDAGGIGSMELKLRGGGETIRIGSSISGFRAIASAACDAAERNRLNYSAATLSNLAALGLPEERAFDDDDGR